MIEIITKKNLEILKNSFIDFDYFVNEFNNNPFAKLVILKEDEIIGYIYYSDIYDRIEINQFEVKKEFRSKGKGKYLLKSLIEIENKDMTLEVKEDNESAIKVYKNNQFVEVAKRKGYYNGIDGILMERKCIWK